MRRLTVGLVGWLVEWRYFETWLSGGWPSSTGSTGLGFHFDPISMILQCCNPTDLDTMNLIIFGENARRDLVKLSKLTLYFDLTLHLSQAR